MLKRIFAVVSDADFYAFQQKAKSDGMDMGQALAALTHIYARGIPIEPDSIVKHKDHFAYIKAHNDETLKPHLKDVEQ